MDIIDIGLYINDILLIVSIVALVVLEAFNLLKDPKSLVKTGLVIAGLVALFAISYAMSSGSVTNKYIALGVDEGLSRLIGAGLIMLYIFLFVSIAGMVISEIYKIFK
ncbi:MAG TPA: hypothetical protein VK508_01225 [Cyclobacteriaceae bacterium]|nr:hypothetical protein [Cyclobacteriaceae bacterium]